MRRIRIRRIRIRRSGMRRRRIMSGRTKRSRKRSSKIRRSPGDVASEVRVCQSDRGGWGGARHSSLHSGAAHSNSRLCSAFSLLLTLLLPHFPSPYSPTTFPLRPMAPVLTFLLPFCSFSGPSHFHPITISNLNTTEYPGSLQSLQSWLHPLLLAVAS